MTIYNIPNARRFLEKVRSCSGEVHYLDNNGRLRDLKAVAMAFTDTGLERFMGPIDKIEVFARRQEDTISLISFIAGMSCPRSS